jgi:hypothetical protein
LYHNVHCTFNAIYILRANEWLGLPDNLPVGV